MSEPILIVLPFCQKDWQLTEKILQLCVGAFGTTRHECLLSFDDATNPIFVTRIQAQASEYFSKVHAFRYDAPVITKWPEACNHAFQRTAWHIADTFKCSWLWLEGDAIPLRADWIDILQAEYDNAGQPFMGHIVEGVVGPPGHMNGVAIYPAKLYNFTKNALLAHAAAWDVCMAKETIAMTHRANHLIGHLWNVTTKGVPINGPGQPVTFRKWADVERYVDLKMCLFHRSKDGTLARMLLNKFQKDANVTKGSWRKFINRAAQLVKA